MEPPKATDTDPRPLVSERGAPPRMKLPPQRYIAFPTDVASKSALRQMLSETDVFGPALEEARAYLDSALQRFRITMALIPPLPSDTTVLELGANPYFITRLLRQRGLDVRAANWFGDGSGFGDRGRQRVVESGVIHDYEFDHFNIEQDHFPYPDGTFDFVLCCEILEHLPNDPTHTLAEIHRVLKEGGTLLLTTPNANRLENLVRVQQGENMYEALSGYGVYGRHNREYTVSELTDLLAGCGYRVDDIFDRDIWVRPARPVLAPGIDLTNRGENLFVLATTVGEARWYYPNWLYQSIHGYRRAVLPELFVGRNCDLQTSGLHKLEDFGGRPGRWTAGTAEATCLVAPSFGGSGTLRIEGRTPDIGGSLHMRAKAAGTQFSWELPCDGLPFSVEEQLQIEPGEQPIAIWGDRAWCPAEDGDSLDPRVLGFVIHRVALTASFEEPIQPDVVVGVNCTRQLSGVHALEEVHGRPVRWTDGQRITIAQLIAPADVPVVLRLEGWTPPLPGKVEIRAEVEGKPYNWTLAGDDTPFAVETIVDVAPGTTEVRLSSDRSWRPCDHGGGPDSRTLGFLLSAVSLSTDQAARNAGQAGWTARPVRRARNRS